jgi:serine/threonine-protein kinase
MRLFEILNLTILLVIFVGALVPKIKRTRWTAYLSVLTVLFILLHLFFEGYRWQMVFPYILTFLLFLGTVRTILLGADKKRESPSRFRKNLIIAGIVLRFLMLAIAITCVILSPKRQLQQPTEPGVGNTRIRPADGMVMVYVPAGEFKMGAPGLEWIRWPQSQRELKRMYYKPFLFTDEIPQHVVYLDAFWIDKTEVTVAMFRTFVEATGYKTTAERQGWGKPWTDGPKELEWPKVNGTDWQHPYGPESTAKDDHPVTQVSWEDAAAYCKWVGGQLPTEAQWEKACRGTDGRMWPWGNTFDGTRVSSCDAQCPIERWKDDSFDDGYAFAAPVGSFPAGVSPYDALDMVGNVWEWVADWYEKDYYHDSPYKNPLGPASGTLRAMRGGAWYDTDVWVTCTVRHQNPPWDRYSDVGFRCVVPVKDNNW